MTETRVTLQRDKHWAKPVFEIDHHHLEAAGAPFWLKEKRMCSHSKPWDSQGPLNK